MSQHAIKRGQRNRSTNYAFETTARRARPASIATLIALGIAGAAEPAMAQEVRCPEPAAESDGGSSGQPASARLRSPDPLVREMARGDIAYDAGRRDEAIAIYTRLASARPDRRQTARRAQLKLAQAALSSGDFEAAERYLEQATSRGALPELRDRASRLRASIASRQDLRNDELAIENVDALLAANRLDEADAAARALLTRPCPNPVDYASRAKIRLAQVQRAKGNLGGARSMALEAQRSATTDRGRERAGVLLGELQEAEQAARIRQSIDQANAMIAAGNAPAAIGILEPLLASQPALPADLATTVRLRLARAYVQAERHDMALAVLNPLLGAGGAPSALGPEQTEAVARILLSRANALQRAGGLQEAADGYRQVLAFNPPADVRDSARLGLARTLYGQGDRAGALQQIAFVRDNPSSPGLLERANSLLADLDDGVPMNRLFGYVEAGAAYDTNVPTRVSAVQDDNDDDVDFPANRKFDDGQVNFAGRLQYRHQLGQSANYLDLSAAGLRTVQFKLSELDRTRVELRAGPVFALPGGRTDVRVGGQFDVEWRGDRFRYSESGAYAGVRHELSDRTSASAVYSLLHHNDYRNDRDGIHHALDTRLQYRPTDADVVTFNLSAEREGAKVKRFRNVGLAAGAAWRHRWPTQGRFTPFVEASAEAERVLFDGRTEDRKRRDWKTRLEAAVGTDIDRKWRARLHYAYYDVSSNISSRERRPDHQLAFTMRYLWN